MSTNTVDGLVSGMNTSQVISQLMQVEAQPQTDLKNKVTTEQGVIKAFQSVNSKVAALATAAATLQNATTWGTAKATSSSSTVSATAGAGATTGSYTFDVKALAAAQVSTAIVPSTGSIQDGSGVSVTIGGTTTPITVTTDTAQGVADAINKAGLSVNASVINTEQGTVLQVNSTKTGTANAFSVQGVNGTFTDVTSPSDAQVGVGTVGAGGYTVSSSSNTFTNVIPNVTLTAGALQSGVTVNVTQDAGSIAGQVQAMVDAANGLLTEVGTQGQYASQDGSTQTGPLSANFTITSMPDGVLGAVSNGMANFGSFAQLGVQLTKDGTVAFDKDAFIAAYNANPSAVQNAVQNGLAKSMADFSTESTANVTGAIQDGNETINTLNDEISDWDTQLSMRQQTLQTQFSNMEVALGKLKDQGSWLSGQIASLPGTTGG